MAVVTPAVDATKKNIIVTTWAALKNGDVGAVIDYPQHADRNIQVFGTFGPGGSIKLEGSNDGINWQTLTDMTGTPLTFITAGIKMVQENTLYVRPSVTAGDGSTSLNVIVVARKSW